MQLETTPLGKKAEYAMKFQIVEHCITSTATAII